MCVWPKSGLIISSQLLQDVNVGLIHFTSLFFDRTVQGREGVGDEGRGRGGGEEEGISGSAA